LLHSIAMLSNETSKTNNVLQPIANHFTINVIVLSVIAFVIVFINLLACILFLHRMKKSRKVGNILVFSLCISCLLSAVILIPVILIDSYYEGISVTSFVSSYLLYSSVLHQLALSRDRYLIISRPLVYFGLSTDNKRSKRILFLVWVAPIILSLVPLLWWLHSKDDFINLKLAYLVVSSIISVLMSTLVTVTYILIMVKNEQSCSEVVLKLHSRIDSQERKDRRNVLRVSYSLLLFLYMTIIPNIYINVCLMSRAHGYLSNLLKLYGIYSFAINSIFTPVAFFYIKKNYIYAIKKALGSLLSV